MGSQGEERPIVDAGQPRRGAYIRIWGWSPPVAATLYPERERSVRRWGEDIFEALRRQRRQSFGIAGNEASHSRRLGGRLVSRHRLFIFNWHRTGEFGLRHAVARGWH